MLRSSNNRFDQFVKRTLEDATAEPPRFLWDRIEKQLPANTKWYSKYKYLLLLGILGFSSSTSIFIYKTLFLKNNVSKIAIKKRLLKDELASGTIHPAITTALNTSATTVENKTSSKNKGSNVQNNASVASFYIPENNASKKDDVFNTKRQERLKRFEVKQVSVEKINVDNPQQVNAFIASSISTNSSQGIEANLKNNVTSDNSDAEKNVKNISVEIDGGRSNTLAASNDNTNSEITAAEDITPIAEPMRKTEAEPLTVSMSPVKAQASPLSSRQVLESLVKPEKLEKLKLESKSGSINLDPKKAKMLRIKKQFNGYDINKGFHIGAFFNLNNNWLTNKYYSADENTTSIKPQMRIGKAYGINIGYDYTDRWGIELELQVSEQGQKYLVEQQDGPHSKSVNLMYTKLPLMVKYKHTFINNFNTRPMAVSFLFGPQMSILVKQKVLFDGERMQNAPGYNKTELGLTGGFDYDLFLTRFMCLTVGARAGFGSTLKKGQPMSFQLGMTTQFNFRFPKKLK
ncbi:MAG: hypothetical protein JWN78_296 [Bacteroidota bacterium]|nr:hypothetical protein [Bacteroidota bacterium]